MIFQHFLYNYYFFTLVITSYFFYGLYKTENSFHLFLFNLSNSLFYLCLLYNLIFMLFVLFLNYFTFILFGRITSLEEIIDTKKFEFKYMFRRFMISGSYIKNKIEKIPTFFFPQFLSFYIFLIIDMVYQKGESLNSGDIFYKRNQFKYILLYIIMLYINIILYEKTIISNDKITTDPFYEYFIIYELNYDYFRNILKILEGLFRLIININFNDGNFWKYINYAYDIITFIKYVLDLSYQIKINIFLYINHEYFISFIVYEAQIILNFIQFAVKLYFNYRIIKYIRSLTDYDINLELELHGDINKNMNDEEINNIKKEKISQCIICLSDMENGKYLNCGHAFHFDCIKEWIIQCNKKNSEIDNYNILIKIGLSLAGINKNSSKCPHCKSPIDLKANKKNEFLIKKLGLKANPINNDITKMTNNDINIKTQKTINNKELISNIELDKIGSKKPNKEKVQYINYSHDNNESNSGTNIYNLQTKSLCDNNNEKTSKKIEE